MKTITAALGLVMLGLFSSAVLSDCLYQGRWYPTGTNIGGVICQPDGTWR